MSEPQYEGWAAFDKTSVQGNLRKHKFTPKTFQKDDVEMKILYCGICASDLHTISEGWGSVSSYPQVVGHEIVGEVIRVGDEVANGIKIGDLIGVGAQCDSCRECGQCHAHMENYCDGTPAATYNDTFRRGPSKGEKTWGGYANYWRGPSHFAAKIPKTLDPAMAAPLMCAGATVFAPLKDNGAGTTAKNVGVIGIGGLGHLAIIFAKAMGAEVTAISHGASKIEDAKKMGASHVIVTGDDAAAAFAGKQRSLDLIIQTANDASMPMGDYLGLLKPGGTLHYVGVPDGGMLPPLSAIPMLFSGLHLSSSLVASPSVIQEMLDFASTHKVESWIKKYPMDKVNEAIVSMHKGGARYRYVLVNEENGGKL